MDTPAPPEFSAALPSPACPFCCEAIRPGARKCPHCQEYLDPALAPAKPIHPASPYAIAAFVLGLVSPILLCFPAPIAVLLGVTALVHRREAGGKGLAIIGLVLGILWSGILLLMIIYVSTHFCGTTPKPSDPAK